MFQGDASSLPLLERCPAPFLDVAGFQSTGGFTSGRLCSNLAPGLTCCLPCPVTDWIYSKNFKVWYKAAQVSSAIGCIITLFLLLSWAVLPAVKTRRHFLSTCLVIGIFLECLALVIPLIAQPEQCYNVITPNDMRSDLTCALSGSCIVLGGLIITVWIAIRALSMHLQVCWDIMPGTRFFYCSLGAGWGISIIIFIITMTVTGVSYRFSDTCHVNSKAALADFWIPLLVMAAIAGLLQVSTFLYCFKVYLTNFWKEEPSSTARSSLPSYQSSTKTYAVKMVYQRVKKVMWLQWRSMSIVVFLMVDIVFFAVVWIELDISINAINAGKTHHIMPFLTCLITHSTIPERERCFPLGQAALVSESVSIAILLLLSLAGIQTGLLMIRSGLWQAWRELFSQAFSCKQEFVSVDAKRFSQDTRGLQLQGLTTPIGVASPRPASPSVDHYSFMGQPSPSTAQQPFVRTLQQSQQHHSYIRPWSVDSTRPLTSNSQRKDWDVIDPLPKASSLRFVEAQTDTSAHNRHHPS